MNILAFGGSGLVGTAGMIGGLIAELPGVQLTRHAVGNSPGTQFAYHGDMDFGRFDAVIFSCLGPDEMYFEQAGGYDFVSSLYYELFSTIQAQTNLYVAGTPLARYLENASEVACMQADVAAAAGARYVGVRDFVLAHGEAFVPKGTPLMAGEAHMQLAIATQYGHHLGRVIAATVGDHRPGRSFAANFRRIEAANAFEGRSVARGTRHVEDRFAELRLGGKLRFGSAGRPVGYYVDYRNTYCFARLSGAEGSVVQRLYLGRDPEKMMLQFISLPGEVRYDELEIVPPEHSFRDAVAANILPVAPPPIASIGGIAFWNGEVRDLGLSRRGVSVRPYDIPALDPLNPLVLSARDIPAARGWHPPANRPDVGWTRLTGPDAESHLVVDCVPGRFAMRLHVLGAVADEALRGLGISIDGVTATPTIGAYTAAGYPVTAAFAVATAGRKTIALRVPAMRDGYGLEVGRVEFLGVGDG